LHPRVPDELPDGHTGYEQGGWEHSYFTPMRKYFSALEAP
jgi:hypothetical protein